MGAGVEHSAPLKVKYHRLQHVWQLARRRVPLQKTRNPVESDVFLKMHSFRINRRGKDQNEVNQNETSEIKNDMFVQKNGSENREFHSP